MKLLPSFLGSLALALTAFGADPAAPTAPAKPELRGVIVTSSEQRFLIATGGTTHSKWVSVGDSFGAYDVTEYRLKDATLVLKQKDGTEVDLTLANSTVQAGDGGKATVEEAKQLFDKMHMAEMLAKMMDQQKKMIGGQMMQGLKRLQGDATPEEMAAFKTQLLDKIYSALDSQKMTDNMAQIYSQEFTSEQLKDMADYYDTPTGQAMIAKMPEIQMKTSQLLMPQIQAMIPQVTQMEKDFAAAHAPAPAAPAAPATP